MGRSTCHVTDHLLSPCRRGVVLGNLLLGGGQEGGRRAGTESVLLLAGLGRAAELALSERDAVAAHMQGLRDSLQRQLQDALPKVCGVWKGGARRPRICRGCGTVCRGSCRTRCPRCGEPLATITHPFRPPPTPTPPHTRMPPSFLPPPGACAHQRPPRLRTAPAQHPLHQCEGAQQRRTAGGAGRQSGSLCGGGLPLDRGSDENGGTRVTGRRH